MKSGNYIDERILSLRNFYERTMQSYDLLVEKPVICGKRVRFIPIRLFDGNAVALAPEGFMEMPERIAKVKYISRYRPSVILTNSDYNEDLCFHLLKREEVGTDAAVGELIQQMQDAVAQNAPETVFYDNGDIAKEGLEVSWFEYKNFTLDEETYHLQFLAGAGSWLLAGMFHCRICVFDEWKNPVLKSLEYMKLGGDDTDECR